MTKVERVKYLYWFPSHITNHTHLYLNWVEAAVQAGLNAEMFTSVRSSKLHQYGELGKKFLDHPHCQIITARFRILLGVRVILYILRLLLEYDRVVVHHRKSYMFISKIFKFLFSEKYKVCIEYESNPILEMEYLDNHIYKDGFYDSDMVMYRKLIKTYKKNVPWADRIFVLSPYYKEILKVEFPDEDIEKKVTVLTTGVDTKRFNFSEILRQKKRQELGLQDRFLFVYSGSVYHSWKNLGDSTRVFKRLREKYIPNAFFLFLVPYKNHSIALEFIEKADIDAADYLLTSVRFDQVSAFLNASDIGVMLFKKHELIKTGSPGKYGEYVACGLPVLIPEYAGIFADEIKPTNLCPVIKNPKDYEEIAEKIKPFLNYSPEAREQLSAFAQDTLSIDAFKDRYLAALRSVVEE